MNYLESYIKKAEEKWLKIVSEYCEEIFSMVNIPSHDHTHHQRVWNYSKEIIQAINSKNEVNYEFVEASLISSFFHDTGLSITLDEYHGKESRDICLKFFDNNKFEKPQLFDEMLLAIEKHDDKNYKNTKQNPHSLLSVLCNADDLDAFGNIGIVRYTEIYLLRGIKFNELANLVLKNLDKRFINFTKTYTDFPELIDRHKQRYDISKKFFQNLLKEI